MTKIVLLVETIDSSIMDIVLLSVQLDFMVTLKKESVNHVILTAKSVPKPVNPIKITVKLDVQNVLIHYILPQITLVSQPVMPVSIILNLASENVNLVNLHVKLVSMQPNVLIV
jgi:hypothetical protein